MSSISLTGSPLATSLTPNRDIMLKEQQEPARSKLNTVQPVAQLDATAPDKAQLQQAVDIVNQALLLEKRALNFSIDEESGRSVIKVFDFKTDELIKQIPSEELLRVAQDIKRLQEEMGQSIGLLIDNRV